MDTIRRSIQHEESEINHYKKIQYENKLLELENQLMNSTLIQRDSLLLVESDLNDIVVEIINNSSECKS